MEHEVGLLHKTVICEQAIGS